MLRIYSPKAQFRWFNEIGVFIPLVESIDITAKILATDALLIQRKIAHYLVEARGARYLVIAKDNQSTLLGDIRLILKNRGQPDFQEQLTLAHGRLESRSIRTTTQLNDYLDFFCVGQVFAVERQSIEKKQARHPPKFSTA